MCYPQLSESIVTSTSSYHHTLPSSYSAHALLLLSNQQCPIACSDTSHCFETENYCESFSNMFDQDGPLLLNALYGTLFTWGLTAAGAALVFVFRKTYRKFLDASLGFAAGVMTAASFWSLISPAIEMADESGVYGDFAFVPVAIGFALGKFKFLLIFLTV